MSDTFNGYHVWLGIPPNEQPPNHYRLLGITQFETDLDVIDHAADRQMAHVRTFQSGRNAGLSQQILNELAMARLCLLSAADKKAAYDAQLRAKLAVAAPVSKALPVAQPVAKAIPRATPVAPVARPAASVARDDSAYEPEHPSTIDIETLASGIPDAGSPFRARRRRSSQGSGWQRAAALGFTAAVIVGSFMALYHFLPRLMASPEWKEFFLKDPAPAAADPSQPGSKDDPAAFRPEAPPVAAPPSSQPRGR